MIRVFARSSAMWYSSSMPRRLSLDRACDLFLDHLKVERNLAPNTIESYSRDLLAMCRFLAERGTDQASQVTIEDLTEYLLAMMEGDLGARSRGRAVVAIRGLFRYLCRERYLEDDPTERLDSPALGQSAARCHRHGGH